MGAHLARGLGLWEVAGSTVLAPALPSGTGTWTDGEQHQLIAASSGRMAHAMLTGTRVARVGLME